MKAKVKVKHRDMKGKSYDIVRQVDSREGPLSYITLRYIEKYYEATIKWSDNGNIEDNKILKIGDFWDTGETVTLDDDDIFFYLESEEELESFKKNGHHEWTIIEVTKNFTRNDIQVDFNLSELEILNEGKSVEVYRNQNYRDGIWLGYCPINKGYILEYEMPNGRKFKNLVKNPFNTKEYTTKIK